MASTLEVQLPWVGPGLLTVSCVAGALLSPGVVCSQLACFLPCAVEGLLLLTFRLHFIQTWLHQRGLMDSDCNIAVGSDAPVLSRLARTCLVFWCRENGSHWARLHRRPAAKLLGAGVGSLPLEDDFSLVWL